MHHLPMHDESPTHDESTTHGDSPTHDESITQDKSTTHDESTTHDDSLEKMKNHVPTPYKSTVKSGEDKTTRMLYIKGKSADIVQYARSHPITFKKDLIKVTGPLNDVKLLSECVRIACLSVEQRQKCLEIKKIDNVDIQVSEPYSLRDRKTSTSTKIIKGIIFGIPTDVTDDELKEELNVDWVKRLEKWVDGNKMAITTVVFAVDGGTLPQYVRIGFTKKFVKEYIPLPMRCFKCQAYGHRAIHCRSQEKCPRCGEKHNYENCDKEKLKKCPNCEGDHSAGATICSKYIQVQKTLATAVREKLTYAQASKRTLQIASTAPSQQIKESEQIVNKQNEPWPSLNQIKLYTSVAVQTDRPTESTESKIITNTIEKMKESNQRIYNKDAQSENIVEMELQTENHCSHTRIIDFIKYVIHILEKDLVKEVMLEQIRSSANTLMGLQL